MSLESSRNQGWQPCLFSLTWSQSHVLFLAQHESTLSSESRGGVLELQKGKFGNYNHIICCEHNICNFFMNRHAIHHALLTKGTCVIMWGYRWQRRQSLLSYFLIPPLPWESPHRGRGNDKKCVTQWIHGASKRAKISPFLLPSIAMAVTPEGRALLPCLCCDQPLLSWEKEIKGSIRQLSCFFLVSPHQIFGPSQALTLGLQAEVTMRKHGWQLPYHPLQVC